jgi:hypothetical protein
MAVADRLALEGLATTSESAKGWTSDRVEFFHLALIGRRHRGWEGQSGHRYDAIAAGQD